MMPQVLFFEDPHPLRQREAAMPAYAHHFPAWSEQTNAMHQYVVWTALEAEGCGANLQHYNPLIDERVKAQWGIDQEWKLRAQLVFGGLKEGAREGLKEKDLEARKRTGTFFYGMKG